MDESNETTTPEIADPEFRQLLGMFDLPAFARGGQDLEFTLTRLDARCRREREGMLDMVRVRLRQWAGAAAGPDAGSSVFRSPIDHLWPTSGAEPPSWASQAAPIRARREIARDLLASVERFNRRWSKAVGDIDLEPINKMIDSYNRYYILEKECVLGSARLASRHFIPRARQTTKDLLDRHPLLLVPEFLP